mgnify:FL=1
MKKLNLKDRLVVIWKWFKSLPKWAKPIVIIILIVIKVVVPAAILVAAVYKYAEHKTVKKIKEETDTQAGTSSGVTSKIITQHYGCKNYLPDEIEEDTIIIPDSVAK